LKKPRDFRIYVDYVHAQLRELLTQYPNIAGIWFDPVMGYYSRPDLFPIEETYALVRSPGIDGHHLKHEEVRKLLEEAEKNNYNLLLNIGPLGDGSVHPEDVETLSHLQK